MCQRANTDSGAAEQLSSVCRCWAQAVRGALLGSEFLDLRSTPGSCKLSRLNSQLLLQWAPCVRCLHLSGWSLNKEGIEEFVAAAVNLSEVVVSAFFANDSARADSILCASKSVLTVRSVADEYNHYMPQNLPQQLQQLEVRSIPALVRRVGPALALQPRFEAFLSMVSSLCHLRVLSLNSDTLALTCCASLPRLVKLSLVHYVAHGASHDLSWLRRQRHDELNVCLVLEHCNAESSQQVVSQLQQIHISHLHLVVQDFPVESQQIWQSFSQCDSFHLELARRAPDVPDVVHTLPPCGRVTSDRRTCHAI